MEKGKVYQFETLHMVRPYHQLTQDGNLFFSKVIERINSALSGLPKHENICMIKFANQNNATNHRAFTDSGKLFPFLNQCSIVLKQAEEMSEAEKIYYLYHAKNIILSWGANSHINFVMVCGNINKDEKKRVLFLGHESYSDEYIQFPVAPYNPKQHHLGLVKDLKTDAFFQNTVYQEIEKWIKTQ